MWEVPLATARKEIGLEGIERLRRLRKWLYPSQKDTEIDFRVAPSLIARSETELFGVSMPRFALRAYLAPDSFVNARRIQAFCQVATTWGVAPSDYRERVNFPALQRGPDATMRSSSCIGDSLLVPPEALRDRKRYHFLTTDLGRAYGENASITGTPFVNHIRLGGGACSQAVCFMATALWQDIARGIYGVAEITALAGDQDGCVLDLGGMTPEKICNYFNHPRVGLSAALQVFTAEVDLQSLKTRQFAEALRCYILSGIPVVVLVDFGRMCGIEIVKGKPVQRGDSCIFSRNGVRDDLKIVQNRCKNEKAQVLRHAVLVVGCQSQRAPDTLAPGDFFINDPLTYPFLKVSAAELAHARIYDEKKFAVGELRPIQFISVTPQEVRLPLMNVCQGQETCLGLLDIAFTVQNEGGARLPGTAFPLDARGETRLVDLRWCEGRAAADGRLAERLEHVPAPARQVLIDAVGSGDIPAQWCWLQFGPATTPEGREACALWVWDATAPPTGDKLRADQLRERYLLAVAVEQGNAWKITHLASPRLKPALISSFHVDQVSVLKDEWSETGVPAVDLYVFMQSEVDPWLQAKGLEPGPPHGPNNPVAVMAELARQPDEVDAWAKRVAEQFPPARFPIVALTSFVPEVTSPQPQAYETACAAVRFLADFAVALGRYGHLGLRTIELVAGSQIGGIWPDQREHFMANTMAADEACSRLLSILHRVLSGGDRDPARDRLAFALELEPGPLYLLRDWQSLRNLCREIGNDPFLSRFVGVNLDIAHWALAGDIRPEEVWDTPEVRNRIVHAHIAGHHRCSHLGDLPMSDLNQPQEFRPWIELLRRIASDRRPHGLPKFDGYVSLELEAAKDLPTVVNSSAEFMRFLRTGVW